MQPFPTFSRFDSPAAYLVLAGLLVAGGSQGMMQNRAPGTMAPNPITVTSDEDDRGSGRLSNRADFLDLLGFRGSGRIQPGPKPADDTASNDTAPYYRGSGRLG